MTDLVFIAQDGWLAQYGMFEILRCVSPATDIRYEYRVLLDGFGWVNANEEEIHVHPHAVGKYEDVLLEIERELNQ